VESSKAPDRPLTVGIKWTGKAVHGTVSDIGWSVFSVEQVPISRAPVFASYRGGATKHWSKRHGKFERST
jgi:hypothetical protein